MNKLVKTILSVMAFGGVVGIAHAEVETASLWGGGGASQHPEGCTELCGSKSIPIEITIPKVCELKNVTTKITLNSTTGTGTGGFSVGANAAYNLLVDTDNRTSGTNNSALKYGTYSIPTTVTTKRGSNNVNLGSIKYNEPMTAGTSSLNDYSITVQTSGSLGISKPAGTYTDKYNISVYF